MNAGCFFLKHRDEPIIGKGVWYICRLRGNMHQRVRGERFWRSLWIFLPFVLWIPDWALVKKGAVGDWGAPEWKVYITGVGCSLVFWAFYILTAGRMRLAGRLQKHHLWTLHSVWISIVLAGLGISLGYFQSMFHLPNVHILEYLIQEPANSWQLVQETFHWWYMPLFATCVALLAKGLVLASEATGRMVSHWRRWVVNLTHGVLFVALVTLSIISLGWHRFQYPLPVDSNFSRIFFQYGMMLGGNKSNLSFRLAPELPPTQPSPYNVLLIVNETLPADAVFDMEMITDLDGSALAPNLRRWMQRSDVMAFPMAWSNSGATNVSVPSILTGIVPEMTTFDFHNSPTLLNLGAAQGLQTFLFTAQDWRWEHFDEYFIDKGVGYFRDRRHYAAPKTNDTGIDDALHTDSLIAYLKRLPANSRFVGVAQYNTTHYPYYGGPQSLSLPAGPERFAQSVRYLDSLLGALLEALDSNPVLRNTLVVLTADHGENLMLRKLPRLGCFHEEALRVPILMRVPEGFDTASVAWKNLHTWTSVPVQNADIMPTLADVMGFYDAPTLRNRWKGESWLRDGWKHPRVLHAQNTAEIRKWQPEGSTTVYGDHILVLSNLEPPALYNWKTDPREEYNLWGNGALRDSLLPGLRAHFQAVKGRGELCERIGNNCPEQLRIEN